MKHFGDITKIKGSEVPLTEIVVGGSPCQDLSVAGKRAGLAGARSGLFMEQIRLIKEMRNESFKQLSIQGTVDPSRIIPRFMVWENVPGAFSSNNGEDFRAVLEETARVKDKDAAIPRLEGKQKWSPSGCIMGDGWSIAWRVHDAQFWGVPQRRKRIALVADFGGESAPEILFERKGMSGDSEPCGSAREETAGAAGDSSKGTSWGIDHVITTGGKCTAQGPCVYEEVEATLKAAGPHAVFSAISFQERAGKPGGGKGILIQDEHTGALSTVNNQSVCAFEPGAASRLGGYCWEDKAGTLRANAGDNQQAVVYGISSYDSNAMKSANPNSGIYKAETSRTLDLNGGSPACNQGGMAVVQTLSSRMGTGGGNVPMVMEPKEPISIGNGQLHDAISPSIGVSKTLNCMDDPAKVMVYRGDAITSPINASNPKPGDPCHTLTDDSRNYVVLENHPADSRVKVSEDGIVQTLSSRMGTGGGNVPMVMEEPYNATTGSFMRAGNRGVAETIAARDYKDPQIVCQSVVRRLTPLECERLQGYPDGWTDIGDWTDSKGKKHKGESDAPRYKALGNSIALPFWEWMAGRMVRFLKNEEPTMASLFSGIGGFELVFARAGCKPVWNSEIESYPEAVTRVHFGDDERGIKGDYEKYL